MKMFSLSTILLVLGMTALTPRADAQDTKFLSALDLAIEHFNSGADRELKSWGPQHTFMYKALEAVEAAYPNLKGVAKLSVLGGGEKFKTLSYQSYDTAADVQTIATLKNQIAELTNGCGFRRTTLIEEQNLGFTKPSQSTTVETSFELESRGSMKCTSPSAKILADFGLSLLTVKERSGGYLSIFEVSLEVGVNTWQDMRYVQAQALAIPGINHDFLRALAPKANDMVIGASTDIALVGSSGKASYNDKFTLVYYQGSGDCPAGCIHKVYTTIEVTPTYGTDPANPQFTIKKL